MRRAALWVGVAAGLLLGPPARAQSASFEGTGEAPITSGDRVRARARALEDALRQVVDAAAASLLDPALLAQRQSALKLTIEPKARSYLAGYRIIDEGEFGGSFRVHVGGEVALDRLERDLHGGGPAAPARSVPRIGVCMVGTRGDAAAPIAPSTIDPGAGRDPAAAPASTARLEAALLAAGAAATPLPGPCTGFEAGPGALPVSDVVKALAAAHLDAVLGARFVARDAGPIRGTPLIGAHVDLRVGIVDAAAARVWTVEVAHDGYGADAATATDATLAAALDAALVGLADVVARRWPGAPTLSVRVRFERYPDLAALERTLAAVAGVTRVEPRRFFGATAELQVEGVADPAVLVAAASRPPSSATSPRYSARAIDAHTVDIEVLPPPPPPALPATEPASAPLPSLPATGRP